MTSRIPALFDMFGVEYDLVSGWEARTSGTGAFDPRFIIDHHTAPPTPFPLSTIIHGSRWRDIPGPLSQFLVRQSGLIHVVGRLRANHAGQGTWGAYLRAINDEPPRRETSAGTYWNGNYRSYGFEQDHPGDGVAPWPDAQLEATARANAALCWHYGWTANRCIAHGEWTSRKFDPHPISYVMKEIRTEVARLLAGEERKDMSYRRMVNDAWLRIVGTHVTGQSPETAQMRLTRLADELKAGPGGKTPSGSNGRDLASDRKSVV